MRARVLAETRKREAEVEERRRRQEAALAAEAEANEKIKRDMKGKAFTMDDNGELIVVRKVNHARIPPAFQAVDIVRTGDNGPEAPVTSPTSSRRVRGWRRLGWTGWCVYEWMDASVLMCGYICMYVCLYVCCVYACVCMCVCVCVCVCE